MAHGVLLVDFDGTIYPWGPLDDDAPPLPGAVRAIADLRADGYTVRIFSSRVSHKWAEVAGESITEQGVLMEERLDKDGIEHDGIAYEKEPAEHYIDDRAIEFKNDWDAIRSRLLGDDR